MLKPCQICNNCRNRGIRPDECDVGGGIVIYTADAPHPASSSSRRSSGPSRQVTPRPGGPRGQREPTPSKLSSSFSADTRPIAFLQPTWNVQPPEPQPLNIDSFSQSDLFHLLPIEAPDPHTLDLLHRFLSGLSDSPRSNPRSASFFRKDTDLPQILEDKGSCHALRKLLLHVSCTNTRNLTSHTVAYLETDLMSGERSRPKSSETAFYYTHVGSAISELRRALANPGYMSITSIMRTVLNLGWAAVSLEEKRALLSLDRTAS